MRKKGRWTWPLTSQFASTKRRSTPSTTWRRGPTVRLLSSQHYVALNAWQIAKIKEGIAAADRGDFATEEEMERLLAKYDVKR